MNEKEVGELRRRLRPEKNSITHIRGCYVNEMGESVAQFDQSLALMTQEETETLLALLRRTLSGTLGKNLLDLSFETRQVVEGEEHRRLMRLRDTALKDEEAVEEFFQLVRQSLTLEGNYLILLVYDRYDVPYRAKDGGAAGGRRRRGVLLPAVLHLPGEADQARPELPRAGERVPQPAGRLAGVPAGAGLPLSRL